jgi:effector-binding domain-containing protein
MNEDLKIAAYKRIVNRVESSEKEAVKRTACILYASKFANGTKEIHFYSSDFMNENEDLFQFEYNIEYTNGDFQNGNGMIDTKDVLEAFGFVGYSELKTYFSEKYNDDERAWHKIVKELEDKGLSPIVDESEGGNDYMTNF